MEDIENNRICDMDDLEVKLGEMILRTQQAIRIGEADKEQTIDLIKRSIGPRSRRKYAEDIGANVSSVSRILTGQIDNIRRPLLAKIAFHADPNSGVTLDQLMQAQGLSDPEDRNQLAFKYERECRRIFVDELLSRDYFVKYEAATKHDICQNRMISDFSLRTNALGYEDTLWMIECKMMSQYSMLPMGYGRSQIWMNSAMAYYYQGGKAGRISLIVDHKEVFEQIKNGLAELTIPNEISVILISTKAGKILDEYIAPLSEGRIPRYVFDREHKND